MAPARVRETSVLIEETTGIAMGPEPQVPKPESPLVKWLKTAHTNEMPRIAMHLFKMEFDCPCAIDDVSRAWGEAVRRTHLLDDLGIETLLEARKTILLAEGSIPECSHPSLH